MTDDEPAPDRPTAGRRAARLRDELRATAAEIRRELAAAADEVSDEVSAAIHEIRGEVAGVADEVRGERSGGDEAAADESEELETVRRGLAIVWGVDDPPSRGPKATLTREAIVTAAIEIADADGLGAVSMRSISKQLGVGTMSLYRHVPGKDELLTMMIDQVNGEAPLVGELPGTWREKLEAMAWGEWELAHRHPWLLAVPLKLGRPVAGPNGFAAFESALRAAAETGLPAREVVTTVIEVNFLVDGAAKASVDSLLAARDSGITNREWWAAQRDVLEAVLDEELYPTFVALTAAGAFGELDTGSPEAYADPIDVEAAFASGLRNLLDGVAARIAATEGGSGGDGP